MRRCFSGLATLALFALAALLPCAATAQDRIALVIGNNRYTNLAADKQLNKAVNDARSVGDALEKIGFKVIRGENLDRQGMVDRVFAFTQQIKQGDIAVMFYAGHGVAISGGNYLLPSDVRSAAPGEEARVRNMAIGEADIVADIQDKKARVAVLLLDACRDNPFRQPGLLRSAGDSAGLTRGREGEGVFAVYSAGFGQSALDSLGPDDKSDNSVFTRVLVPALGRTDAHLGDIVVDMREEVAKLASTVNHQQFPAYYDQTRGGRVYLAPRGGPVAAAPPAVARPAPAAVPPPQQQVAARSNDAPSTAADARGFPSKPINLIVPFAAGGPADVLARQFATGLSKKLGQPVNVSNVPGANGATGVLQASRADADGHTLVMGNSQTHASAAVLNPKLEYDPQRGFAPVSFVAASPSAVLVASAKPQKTVKEFVAFAKSKGVKMISLGPATPWKAACQSFNELNGIKPELVSVPGIGPAIVALLSGTGDYVCLPVTDAMSTVTGGQARALMVAAPRRLAALPNVPSAADAGLKDFAYLTWSAVFAPKDTPAPIVAKLSAAILAAMTDPEVSKPITAAGYAVVRTDQAGPERLAEMIESDLAWMRSAFKLPN